MPLRPAWYGKNCIYTFLAKQLKAPLIVKRTSDIMSKWVDENEKNIARAFKVADQEGAVLLVDEVDSFLRSGCQGF